MTPEQLQSILARPWYNRLAIDVALEESHCSDPWWKIQDDIVAFQAKMCLWEVVQYLLILFDTYEMDIKKVLLVVDNIQASGKNGLFQRLEINRRAVNEKGVGLDRDTVDRMMSTDNLAMLKFTCIGLLSVFTNSTLKYMDIISQGLDNGFSCRADVVNMLNTHAKEAKAKIIQRLLEEHDKSKRRDDQGMEMDRPIM